MRAARAGFAQFVTAGAWEQLPQLCAVVENWGVLVDLASEVSGPRGWDTEAMAVVAVRNTAEAELLGVSRAEGCRGREQVWVQRRLEEAFDGEGQQT